MPVAFVLGCVIIAIGIYFGLAQGRQAPANATPAAPVLTDQLRQRVVADAVHAIEAERPKMTATCPIPPGLHATLTFSLAFDEAGQEIGSGISSDQEVPASNAVANCIRDHFVGELHIPAPGLKMSVRVPYPLP